MRKKILFVVLGQEYSGAEIVLNDYIKNNVFIDSYFVTIYKGNAYDKLIELYGIERVKTLNLSFRKNESRLYPFITQIRVKKFLEKIVDVIKPNIIYVNNTIEVMLCGKYIKGSNLPSIAHIHDMKNSYKSPMKIYEAKKALKYYDRVLTVSESCRLSWKNDKMKVVYNGLSESDFLYSNVSINSSNNRVFGFVGTISYKKGFDILHSVVLNLDKSKYYWKIAYNNIEPGCQKYLFELQKLSNVEIYYDLNRGELNKFYEEIDFLVIPSRKDPLPTVAIEAISKSKLVVGFRIDGIPELINDDDLIVEYVNSESLIEKIKEVNSWGMDKISKKRKRLFNYARKKFSLENKIMYINQMINDMDGIE